jgi:hypothetical protein
MEKVDHDGWHPNSQHATNSINVNKHETTIIHVKSTSRGQKEA